MSDKLSFQHIVDLISRRSGVQRKQAELFAKAFFDTLTETFIEGEEQVGIKGFGIFKLVAVDSRESVNVTNGQRILIPGYKKIAFSPDETVLELLKKENPPMESLSSDGDVASADKPFDGESSICEIPVDESHSEETCENKPLSDIPVSDESSDDSDDFVSCVNDVEIDMPVEQVQDVFSGIDMLISTPESIDEVRIQVDEARAKAEAAIEEARMANAERQRLELLLMRLENNEKPESCCMQECAGSSEASDVACQVAEEESDSKDVAEGEMMQGDTASSDAANKLAGGKVDDATSQSSSVPLPSDVSDEVLERVLGKRHEETKHEKRKMGIWAVLGYAAVVCVLVGVIFYFLYGTFKSIESVEKVVEVVPAKKKINGGVRTKGQIGSLTGASDSLRLADSLKATNLQSADSAVSKKQQGARTEALAQSVSVSTASVPAKSEANLAPSRPKTYVIKRGETLTLISRRFYGTKDSVKAIIRVNVFPNPDNVPVGAVIKLP